MSEKEAIKNQVSGQITKPLNITYKGRYQNNKIDYAGYADSGALSFFSLFFFSWSCVHTLVCAKHILIDFLIVFETSTVTVTATTTAIHTPRNTNSPHPPANSASMRSRLVRQERHFN